MPEGKNRKGKDYRPDFATALFALLEKKAFSDISIVELAKKAGSSADYFYVHFKTKDGLVEWCIDSIISDLGHAKAPITKELVEKQLAGLLKHKGKLLLLHKNGLLHLVQPRIRECYISTLAGQKRLAFPAEHALAAHAGAFYELLRLWLDYGMDPSPAEIMKMTGLGGAEGIGDDESSCPFWARP